MRPRDTILYPWVQLPDWLRALQQAIGNPDAELPAPIISPLAALEELQSLSNSSPPEAPDDRSSLQADLGTALDALGVNLSTEINTAIDAFRRDTLSRLPELLSGREGVQVAAASAQVLQEKLVSDVAVKAAWRDVVTAFKEDHAYEDCLLAIRVLRDSVAARGHAWETETERITRIINDSAPHARQAGANLPLPDDDPRIRHEELPANLSEEDRLSLIEQDLARLPGHEEVVVWLRIDDAVITGGTLALGSVLFIDGRHLRSRVLTSPFDPRGLGLPDGREQSVARELLSGLEGDAQSVFARVQSTGASLNAVPWARGAVAGLLDVATLSGPRPGWELTEGYIVVSGRGMEWKVFGGPSDPHWHVTRAIHRPDEQLRDIDERLVTAWTEGDPAAGEAIELARWERALAVSPNEAFRVALGVRNLERVLPAARISRSTGRNAHWTRIVAYYLKDAWCWDTLRGFLNDVRIASVTPPVEFRKSKDGAFNDFYKRRREIIGSENLTSTLLIKYAPALADLVPPRSSRRRIIRTVVNKTDTPSHSVAWLDEIAANFDVLLARSARQRNATVHGSATVPAVITTVSPFVSDLGRRVVHGAMAAAASGDQLAVWFERVRLKAREDTASLEAGRSLDEVI